MRKLLLIIPLLFIATTAFAQNSEQVTIDLKDVPQNMREQIRHQAEQQEMQQKVSQYGEWVGLGKEVGTAVQGSLDALTTSAIDFSQTDLGKATMFIVVFKVIGEDLIQFIVGPIFFMLATVIILYSYLKRTKDKILIKGSRWRGTAEYETTGTSESNKAAYAFAHMIFWLVSIAITCLIMFG